MAFSSSSCNSSAKRSWLSIAIWVSLIVASVNCETYKLKKRDNKESIGYAVKAKRETSRQPRFIKFDTSPSKIDMDLELSIPFLSIPLPDKNKDVLGSASMPLVKINPRSFMIFGAIMGISRFVLPLLSKLMPGMQKPSNIYNRPNYAKEHKRTDRGLDFSSYIEDSINEILDVNSTLAPCIERLVCSAVATATTADEPNNLDKIVDALSSNKLFEEAVNGTVIKEAAAKGREVLSAEDCATTYTECAFNQKILLNVLKIIGL